MYWQFTRYSIPLIIAAVGSAALAFYAWRRRQTTPAAKSLTLMMLAVAEWSVGYAIELGSTNLAAMVFWSKIEYLGIVTVPLAWLVFALQFSNRDRWLTQRNLVLLSIVPAITLLLAWTNEAHNLVWSHFVMDTDGPFSVLIASHGAWFWVHSAFSYTCLLGGTVLLFRMVTNLPDLYRWQAGLMLLGVLAPWISNGLYLSGLSLIPHLDLTPFAFTLTGLTVAWNLFRFRFLDVVPVARRAIVEGMSDGVVVLDNQNRIVDFNPAAQKIISRPAAAIMGQLAGQVFSDRADLVERYRNVLEASTEIMLGQEEARRYFDLRISPLYDRNHHLSGRLIVLRDITEQKQAEEALRQREQQFRQVVASISDHIYMTEVTAAGQKVNLYLSPHVEILSGYPLTKFINDWSFWPTVVIHPDDRARAAEQAARLTSGQNSQLEYRLVRANGEIIWVRDSGRTEYDSAQQRILIYGVVSDITERKRTEVELALARDQALEASRLKTDLLARVSHELRTPLGAILGFAELLKFGIYGPLLEEQKMAVGEIIDSTNNLTSQVNDLLDQAKLEAGRLALHLTTFSPADLLNSLLHNMEMLAHNKGLSLTTHIAANMPGVLTGDFGRLQQVLVNLISNAIKFTPTGTVKVCLYRPDNAHWAIQVIDTGIGIPSAAQAHLFEPFMQVDGSMTRKQSGTGLGLSIVKQLTDLMGGEITLESKPGHGSTFVVLLPLQPGEQKVR